MAPACRTEPLIQFYNTGGSFCDLMGALKLGVHIGLDEIRGDEFCAVLIIAQEMDLLELERTPRSG